MKLIGSNGLVDLYDDEVSERNYPRAKKRRAPEIKWKTCALCGTEFKERTPTIGFCTQLCSKLMDHCYATPKGFKLTDRCRAKIEKLL